MSSSTAHAAQALPASQDQDLQRKVNTPVYGTQAVVRDYAARREMPCNEGVALLHYHAAFAGREVLDIGVGAGRTTRFVAPLASRYECIDYSPVMVDYMHRTMPEISTALCDAADLSRYADASFDFVFASNCVIDALSPQDRLRALREAARVLRTGGHYMFSSHNLSCERALLGPQLKLSRNPLEALRSLRSYVRQMRNYRRLRTARVVEADHAVLNDTGHDYALLHYYIDVPAQRRQLAAAGLELLDVFNGDGRRLRAEELGTDNLVLLYVARKG